MTTLLLRLAGPLQSWGSSSRFVRRGTERQPTKSGVLGLLAAALGRRRTDPIEDLLELRFGVRIDQPGQLLRDFQTARTLDGRESMPLSYRFYLADAVFLAAIEGDQAFLENLMHALLHPTFPLYLGRRSCPPVGPLTQGIREKGLRQALADEPWSASPWWQRRHRYHPSVALEVVLDAGQSDPSTELAPDVPLSFDSRRRSYGLRAVTREAVTLPNPEYGPAAGTRKRVYAGVGDDEHNPMAAFWRLTCS